MPKPKQIALRDRPTEELLKEAQWDLRAATAALVRATEEALGTESFLMLCKEPGGTPTIGVSLGYRSEAPSDSFERLSKQLAVATEAVRHARAKWETIHARR